MDMYKYVKEPPETEEHLKRLEALTLEIPKCLSEADAANRHFMTRGTEELLAVALSKRGAYLELRKEFNSLKGKVERSRAKQSAQDSKFWNEGI